MATTTADLLVDRLCDWGVEVVFGLPGDGINGLMEALRQRQEHVRFVQVRHEESAALMACGYAKFTGRLGVCLATSGPGGIHLLNGLYDAKLDGQPVLAITGLPFHDLIGTFTQQDVALDRLFTDVAKYSERVMGPTHVESVTDLACRTALSMPSVTKTKLPLFCANSFPAACVSTKQGAAKGVSRHCPMPTSKVRLPKTTAPTLSRTSRADSMSAALLDSLNSHSCRHSPPRPIGDPASTAGPAT